VIAAYLGEGDEGLDEAGEAGTEAVA
jgi:hypothetical protein